MKEILNKTVEVENDLIVITEETKTTKDRRQLDNELTMVQRQIMNLIEQNKRLVLEHQKLLNEEQVIKEMIDRLPKDTLNIIE